MSVRLTGRNFPLWEFQFRIFVQGRRMTGILDGTSSRPADDANDKEKADWETNNALVIFWILSSVDPGIALSLRGFSTTHSMWS
ncbi:unnamed protein product [Linum trigynum]|uniref:Retrotransposon Copia-like N-terminal domain-containing protein n=1 Tax=Linum trigynum TaxID=586398 RepID=A0AAV2GQY6_9ROSI